MTGLSSLRLERDENFTHREAQHSMMALLFSLLVFASLPAAAAEAPIPDHPWPLWDGREPVEQYAQRVQLPAKRTLDLGNEVRLELALIPAGTFVMGAAEPSPVDEAAFGTRILVGQVFLALGMGVLLILLGTVIFRAIRKQRRPQYSLALFLAAVVAACTAAMGGLHGWQSSQALLKARADYTLAKAYFDDADVANEKPAHSVTLTSPYYMSIFLVTQEQYQQVMGENPSETKGERLPVENVPWDTAKEFCKHLSEKARQTVRLPTEAEWEFACRAGTQSVYYAGNDERDLMRAGWYDGNSGGNYHPVGEKEPNAFGLYDMHGNIWQWCLDYWSEDYAKASERDPVNLVPNDYPVMRGGSRNNCARNCSSAYRRGNNPVDAGYVGFRITMPAAKVP